MKNEIITGLTIGSDLELFVFDERKGECINAKPYVKGSKRKPFNFDPSNKFWCTSLDNVSMEGNIPPTVTAEEFDSAIQKVIDFMNSTLPEGLKTTHDCAVYFNPDELNTKEAMQFACDCDYSAYNPGIPRDMPSAASTTLRTCCTHIHMKYDNMNPDLSIELIKAMDLFLGLPSLLIEPSNPRRELYGTLGAFRYGSTTEYRVLSSFFSQNSIFRKWMFNNTLEAVNWINAGNRITEEQGEEFQAAVRNNDLAYIKKVVDTYNVPMP